jgi:hypothetical protein
MMDLEMFNILTEVTHECLNKFYKYFEPKDLVFKIIIDRIVRSDLTRLVGMGIEDPLTALKVIIKESETRSCATKWGENVTHGIFTNVLRRTKNAVLKARFPGSDCYIEEDSYFKDQDYKHAFVVVSIKTGHDSINSAMRRSLINDFEESKKQLFSEEPERKNDKIVYLFLQARGYNNVIDRSYEGIKYVGFRGLRAWEYLTGDAEAHLLLMKIVRDYREQNRYVLKIDEVFGECFSEKRIQSLSEFIESYGIKSMEDLGNIGMNPKIDLLQPTLPEILAVDQYDFFMEMQRINNDQNQLNV